MASASQYHGFVTEIPYSDLLFEEVVGKGSYGVVSKAKWRGRDVAVKVIETEAEKQAFMHELKQLSRVNHPNIVQLYGACTNPHTPICLVMEYAEGGSLYNVLHGTGPLPEYSAAHAMSWALQCARGVEYLHSLNPKALIHRDLKPPNLLLIMGGTVLKICDFGTACDIQTHMTNNKGSAAWMAPEVFEGNSYTEKCDVFSWGIILWEIFTRHKPFDDLGGPAFRIMWAVHNGKRPPLIKNLPKPLELLMTRCWSGNPVERPSMSEVVRIMDHLFQFFKGADKYLEYPPPGDSNHDMGDATFNSELSFMTHSNGPMYSHPNTLHDTVRYWEEQPMEREKMRLPSPPPPLPCRQATTAASFQSEPKEREQQSAPPSLAASRESLNDPRGSRSGTPVDPFKRYSADLTKMDEMDILKQAGSNYAAQKALGHRRAGSHGTPIIVTATPGPSQQPLPGLGRYSSYDALAPVTSPPPLTPSIVISSGHGHRRIGSDEYGRISTGYGSALDFYSETPLRPPGPPPSVPHCSTYPQLQQAFQEPPPPVRSVSHPPALQKSSEPPPIPARSISHTEQSLRAPTVQMESRPTSWSPDKTAPAPAPAPLSHSSRPDFPELRMGEQPLLFSHAFLDYQLQPLAPYPQNAESMQIYEIHNQLAEEYLQVQREISYLTQRKQDLIRETDTEAHSQQSSTRIADEYTQLSSENESLALVYEKLKKELDMYRQGAQCSTQNKRVGIS